MTSGPGGTGPDAASPGAAGLLWLWAMVTGLGAGDPPASPPAPPLTAGREGRPEGRLATA